MNSDAKIYVGEVVHKRVRPRPHALKYSVFSFFIDVDALPDLAKRYTFYSHNRFNVFATYDVDHGPGDGTPPGVHAREILKANGISSEGLKIHLLAYPRVFGYVFNPLSVYFCFNAGDTLKAIIYEVNNTFGERTPYVINLDSAKGSERAHGCAKRMIVSPFAGGTGRYDFRISSPGDDVVVGVQLRDEDGPLLRAHFKGHARAMNDRTLAGLALQYPLMTAKVIIAIHYEALKLWLKGVPLAFQKTVAVPQQDLPHSPGR